MATKAYQVKECLHIEAVAALSAAAAGNKQAAVAAAAAGRHMYSICKSFKIEGCAHTDDRQ